LYSGFDLLQEQRFFRMADGVIKVHIVGEVPDIQPLDKLRQ
jgi:hypothetical protein